MRASAPFGSRYSLRRIATEQLERGQSRMSNRVRGLRVPVGEGTLVVQSTYAVGNPGRAACLDKGQLSAAFNLLRSLFLNNGLA